MGITHLKIKPQFLSDMKATDYDSAHCTLALNKWTEAVDSWYHGNELPGTQEGWEFV